MTTVEEIIAALRDEGELGDVVGDTAATARHEVVRVAPDLDAVPGDLSWISPRALEAAPDRPDGFRGTVCVCPVSADPEPAPGRVFLRCHRPKLSVIHLIELFFAADAATNLPMTGERPVSPNARIAHGVRLGHGVVVGAGAVLEEGCTVGPNTVLTRVRVGRGTTIGANCTVGLPGFGLERDETGRWRRFPHVGGVVIGEDVEIGANTCIDRGAIGDTVIRRGARIDNLVHVAHNVLIEENAVVIAQAMLGGSVEVGEGAWVAPAAAIMNQVRIGAQAVVGLGAVVLRDVDDDAVVVGNPARVLHRDGKE